VFEGGEAALRSSSPTSIATDTSGVASINSRAVVAGDVAAKDLGVVSVNSRAVVAGDVAAKDLAVVPLEDVLARFQAGSDMQRSVGFLRTISISSSCVIRGGMPVTKVDEPSSINVCARAVNPEISGRAEVEVLTPERPNNAFACMIKATCSWDK
jgi:hypothetical protein